LRLDPEYALAHAVLAHARSLLAREGSGGNAAAQASMRRALDLADDDPLIHHCHAALLGNLGRTAEGVRAWERALELDPNNAGARAGLGIARIYMSDPERGLASIDQALRRSPRDPLTYHWLANRAFACALLGRWEEALESAEESVQRTGSQVGYAVLAAALAFAGRSGEARAAYDELLRRAPGLDPAQFRALTASFAPDAGRARAIEQALYRAAGLEAPDVT
jgi:tetratricopeptide (TPR) repeat protein